MKLLSSCSTFMKEKSRFSRFRSAAVVLVCVFALSACYGPRFNYKSGKAMRSEYKYSVKDENIQLYYNILTGPKGYTITGSVKNIGSVYASNFSYRLGLCCVQDNVRKKFSTYENIGDIKAMNVRRINITIPPGAENPVKFEYEFMPKNEDIFVPGASPQYDRYGPMEYAPVQGTLTIIIR